MGSCSLNINVFNKKIYYESDRSLTKMESRQQSRDLKALELIRKYKIFPQPVFSAGSGWRWKVGYHQADLPDEIVAALSEWEWDEQTSENLAAMSFGFRTFIDPAQAII